MRSANSKSLCDGTRREDFHSISCSQDTPYNVFTNRYSTDLVLLLEYNFKVCLKMFMVHRLMIGMPDNVFTNRYSMDLVLLLEYNFKVCLKMFTVHRLMVGTPDNDCVKQRSLNVVVHYSLHNGIPFNILGVTPSQQLG